MSAFPNRVLSVHFNHRSCRHWVNRFTRFTFSAWQHNISAPHPWCTTSGNTRRRLHPEDVESWASEPNYHLTVFPVGNGLRSHRFGWSSRGLQVLGESKEIWHFSIPYIKKNPTYPKFSWSLRWSHTHRAWREFRAVCGRTTSWWPGHRRS